MARHWTCRRCKLRNKRTTQLCSCGTRRPAPRVPQHRRVLDSMPYEDWVERFGERCGVCGRGRSEHRRLDRDHDHKTGNPRGLLCQRCNRALPSWVDAAWLRRAADYLERNAQ